MFALLVAHRVASAPNLIIQKLQGTFPDLLADLSFTPPHLGGSGILRWRIDEDNWTSSRATSVFSTSQSQQLSFRLTKAAVPDCCLRSGPHSLSFQFQPIPDDGDWPIATATFLLPQDYSCPLSPRVPRAASVTLVLTGSGGSFPDLTMSFRATVSDGYSGILMWRADDHDWLPTTFSGSDWVIDSNSARTVSWHSADFGPYCLPRGAHSISLQIQNASLGNSAVISRAFTLVVNSGCGPDVALALTGAGGIFPDLTMAFQATVSDGYSGILMWRVDDEDWFATTLSGSDWVINSNLARTVTWADSDFDLYCLQAGTHLLSLQIQSDSFGNSSVISRDFTLGWNFGCGPAAGLIAGQTSGSFPTIQFYYRAVVTQPYSGVLNWRLDEREWIPVRNASGASKIMDTTADGYVFWNDGYWPQICLQPGSHRVSLQIESEPLGDSNEIATPFTVLSAYRCGTRSPFASSSPRKSRSLFQSPTQSPSFSEFQARSEQASNTGLTIGLVVAGLAGLIVAIGVIVVCCRRKRQSDSICLESEGRTPVPVQAGPGGGGYYPVNQPPSPNALPGFPHFAGAPPPFVPAADPLPFPPAPSPAPFPPIAAPPPFLAGAVPPPFLPDGRPQPFFPPVNPPPYPGSALDAPLLSGIDSQFNKSSARNMPGQEEKTRKV
jgi:hypothetical protein